MEKTQIPDWFQGEYFEKFKQIRKGFKANIVAMKKDPVIFAYIRLGVKVRIYQAWAIHNLLKHKRIALCWARQIGKSMMLAILALWACYYNKWPTGVSQSTRVGLISKDNESAKKLLFEVNELILKGNERMKKLTLGKRSYTETFFTNFVTTPNNSEQITFRNGCYIKSLPPTKKIRGFTFSFCFVDEIAFIEPDNPSNPHEFFVSIIEPTYSAQNAFALLSSTPHGVANFYYEIFDPEEKYDKHEFERIWFPYTICDKPEYLEFVERKKINAEQMGMLELWKQEYEADFTIDQDSFLEYADVEKCVNPDIVEEYEWRETDCSIGIDYGMTSCHTVITVSTKVGPKIRLLYQHSFPLDYDDNSLMDPGNEFGIPQLCKRYKVVKVVVDSCAQGYRTNKDLESKGYDVLKFNFRSDQADRNRGYFMFRSNIHNHKIEYPRIPSLILELKGLQEIQNKITISIRKSPGGFDDRADSFMMSCIPLMDLDEGSFGIIEFKQKKDKNKIDNHRIDDEWMRLKGE